MSDLNRREFLMNTACATGASLAAGLAAGAYAAEGQPSGDKPRVRLALMGLHSRGIQLLPALVEFPEVEIAYVCDPDVDTIPAALKIVSDKGRPTPRVEKDFRVALDDPTLSVLVCAAPDHWHALSTVLACQAGKDVYVEKPCSHNPREGQQMIAAARRYNRVVQVGTQRRSSETLQSMVSKIAEGAIGKVHFVRTWIGSARPDIGKLPVTAPPANLDFNLWCGPAPDTGYKKNLVHYEWHWRWDYGTGECGNNGIHALDVARWGAGVEHAETVVCGGGLNYFDDDKETPDTQLATFDFPGVTIQWEHRTWAPRTIDGQAFGIEFYGADGTILTTNEGYGWALYPKKSKKKDEPAERLVGPNSTRAHLRNFLDCLASRGKPNADIEIGHRSTLLCQLANIAWRTRSTVKFDGQREEIVGNAPASALMGRKMRAGFEMPAIG